jgi:hypothetical protein
MPYQLSYSSISINRRKLVSSLSGSSNKRLIDGELITVKKDQRNRAEQKNISEEIKKIIEELNID